MVKTIDLNLIRSQETYVVVIELIDGRQIDIEYVVSFNDSHHEFKYEIHKDLLPFLSKEELDDIDKYFKNDFDHVGIRQNDN